MTGAFPGAHRPAWVPPHLFRCPRPRRRAALALPAPPREITARSALLPRCKIPIRQQGLGNSHTGAHLCDDRRPGRSEAAAPAPATAMWCWRGDHKRRSQTHIKSISEISILDIFAPHAACARAAGYPAAPRRVSALRTPLPHPPPPPPPPPIPPNPHILGHLGRANLFREELVREGGREEERPSRLQVFWQHHHRKGRGGRRCGEWRRGA